MTGPRLSLALSLLALTTCTATPKVPRMTLEAADTGTISFATVGSLKRVSAARLEPDAEPAVISGELRLPSGAGPFPAVVLMHGCGGLGNAQGGLESPLLGAGHATFV